MNKDVSVKQKEKLIQENLVYMEDITICFGKVIALQGVEFRLKENEVIGLLGDNGAGKSTLIKALNGYHHISGGTVYYNGKPADFRSPRDARRAGIETAYQDLSLVNLMSISRNFFMGRDRREIPGRCRPREYRGDARSGQLSLRGRETGNRHRQGYALRRQAADPR
jgi:ABC-type sugar transport system ATPase subunit